MSYCEQRPSSWSIDEDAISYLTKLRNDNVPGLALQITVDKPLTAAAKITISFQAINQKLLSYPLGPELVLQIASDALPALEGLSMHLNTDALGQSELDIKAPFLYGADRDRPLIDQIKVFFEQEIAPILAQHHGGADIEHLNEQGVLMMRFRGGCQGCSLSSTTLKKTIKQQIQSRFPLITDVVDVTEHDKGANPYA
jgi:Fe/S biogenesis protein NfuA